MVVANNKSTATKITRQMLAILMAMQIQRCNAGQNTQWSASVASCEATAHAVLPRPLPWLAILNETKKH